MKKLIAAAAVALTLASATFAEGITVGLRGIFGLGLGTDLEGDGLDLDVGKSVNAGGALFGKFLIPAVKGLGVQPELGITYNQIGVKNDDFDLNATASYVALDIPVLVTYDFNINDNFAITPEFGPKLSVPFGKLSYGGDMDSLDDSDLDTKVLFSLVFGAAVSYKVGPGAIVGDIRYDLGLTKLTIDTEGDGDFGTPRALLFSVGYGINF